MNGGTSRLLYLTVACGVALAAGAAHGQDDASTVGALLRDLKSPEFEPAYRAAERLRTYPRYRAQIVPAAIEALKTLDWDRCAGDVRDTIARTLGELKAKEAVGPLLEVVKSGTPIEHECLE